MADDTLKQDALAYHRASPPGKISISATKPLQTSRDLALAYSPGVAAACEAIVEDPREAATVTARGNLVAVVTNGTAVLGLGAIGPLASKPVMEGKAVLFKKFAGLDAIDIEVDERDPEKFIETVARLEPSFGAINLEDIKAPECFAIEAALKERMGIPVFHDDQHGTAIIVAAAILNALRVVGKKPENAKLVTSGAGAAAIACLDLLVGLGIRQENVTVTDIHGVVHLGRELDMDPRKSRYAQATEARTLAEVIAGADIFLGLSAPGVLKPEMVLAMAKDPIVMALANPTPEIMPDVALDAREDVVMATGRSDFPNQVNNVLCFPYIFRGALDCGATAINEPMKLACVRAIADLAMQEASDVVALAYGGEAPRFGRDYLIPRPFDPRLVVEIPAAVAQAAMDSGVAERPIEDMRAYRQQLAQLVFRSSFAMKPIFDTARANPKKVVFAEGEERRVLSAVQVAVDEGLVKPILIGRKAVVANRIEQMGLRLREDVHFELCDPEDDPRYAEYWKLYHAVMERKGVTPAFARTLVRTNTPIIAALMVRRGEADAMICGVEGPYLQHLNNILPVIELRDGVRQPSAMNALLLQKGLFFLLDTYITPDPTAPEIAECTLLAAEEMRRFGVVPKVALLSASNFGGRPQPHAAKMGEAVQIIRQMAPDLEVEGEMHGDAAVSESIREIVFPNSQLRGVANLLVMPNVDAANIAFNLLKVLGDGISIGPMLVGTRRPAHILTPSVTVRGIVNMTAVAVADAQEPKTAAPRPT